MHEYWEEHRDLARWMNELADMANAVDAIFVCHQCKAEIYGPRFEGQMSGVNWNNQEIFAQIDSENQYLFCDEHFDAALSAQRRAQAKREKREAKRKGPANGEPSK